MNNFNYYPQYYYLPPGHQPCVPGNDGSIVDPNQHVSNLFLPQPLHCFTYSAEMLEERVIVAEKASSEMYSEINQNRRIIYEQEKKIQELMQNLSLMGEKIRSSHYRQSLKLAESKERHSALEEKLNQANTRLEEVEKCSNFQQCEIDASQEVINDLEIENQHLLEKNQSLEDNNHHLKIENQSLKLDVDLLNLKLSSYEQEKDFLDLSMSISEYILKWPDGK